MWFFFEKNSIKIPGALAKAGILVSFFICIFLLSLILLKIVALNYSKKNTTAL
jgi:hypothetical protein